MIRLKEYYHSGWISFGDASTVGLSRRMFKRIFGELIELGLIRKGKKGFFLASFNKCLSRIFGKHGKYVPIEEKHGSFQSVIDSVLVGMAYNKINQQLKSTQHTILEIKGRQKINQILMKAYIKEGVSAMCLISSRQIGKAIGVSAQKSNSIINWMKKNKIIEINIPVYFNNVSFYNKNRYWNSERNVIALGRIDKDCIKTLVLCK